jgi:uncharacterized cupin superfamily protein
MNLILARPIIKEILVNLATKANASAAVKMADTPIPAGLITGGKPVARTWTAAQSQDQLVTQGVWECTALCDARGVYRGELSVPVY